MLQPSRMFVGACLLMATLSACQPIQAPAQATIPASGTIPASADSADEVIATGFNAPQGVLVDPDGAVWVIDSGLGGEEEIAFVAPGVGATTGSFGETARVVRINADGSQDEIATLPSIAAGQDLIGGARLAQLDGVLYATNSQWLMDAGPDRPANVAAIVKIADGTATEVANTWDIELNENPGGFVVDTHPYGLAAGPDGMLWVADAGANDLLKVDPSDGTVTLVATFDGLPGPFPNAERDNAMETDPVPTGIAFGEDGTAYVSLLSGFPFIPGSTAVMQVAADGTVTPYATGLTMLTDLRLAPDGNLYAVQFAIFGEQGPTPNSGAIIRVLPDAGSEIVAEGLAFPTSIDFDADGNGYVTINGVGAPGSGAVQRMMGLTDREGTPIAQ